VQKLDHKEQFVIFCLETYRQAHGISSREAFDTFGQNGVFDFLAYAFDVLHTQGRPFILDQINAFVASAPPKAT
jgi:hypothetical protein